MERRGGKLKDGKFTRQHLVPVESFITSFGIRRAIEERGLTLGRDVSVITFDDELSYLREGGSVPVFTATRSSVREAGRICAQMLLDVIATPDRPTDHHLLEAELTVGRSTGPCIATQSAITA